MDDTGNPTTSAPETPLSDLSALRQQYEALRHLVVSILVLGVIVAGAFDLFLLREVKYARTDLAVARQQLDLVMPQYQKMAPGMEDFVRKISLYGQTNKDFAPYMAKYRLSPPTPASTSAPPSSVTSPPAGAPKK